MDTDEPNCAHASTCCANRNREKGTGRLHHDPCACPWDYHDKPEENVSVMQDLMEQKYDISLGCP